ncbi:glycoside hydrolase family 43 protein [Pedobacter sp. PWIIR3]
MNPDSKWVRSFFVPTILLLVAVIALPQFVKAQKAHNPIVYADVPDISIIRVGQTYYMSSTTMHLSPGLPIMKSRDLVNWELVSYAYDRLGEEDALNLKAGKNAYGSGSWASSLRYHKGTFYVSTFSSTTGKTYIFSTKSIEKGPWKTNSFSPALHDHSLFFDDDGKVYMIYGGGRLMMVELKSDLSGIQADAKPHVLIENASLVSGSNGGLPAEGSQLFKVNGKYYLFNISWPRGGMRTVLVHRADQLTGPYEGQIALQDKGVAQGGLIQTTQGSWYAYLFRDFGAVGRIPYLVPVNWKDNWPVIGVDHKVPDELDLPASRGPIPGIVASDEFSRKPGAAKLPLVWQWNHNPDNQLWSVSKRAGFLRLSTGQLSGNLLEARNTLSQRTFGPQSSAITMLDVKGMKDGDIAGLGLLQKKYGWVGVKMINGAKFICTEIIGSGGESTMIPVSQNQVYLRADADFQDRTDEAKFYYSLDGSNWMAIGPTLHMEYTLPHFMGYRFALFNYATQQAGGYTDFDFFRLSPKIDNPSKQP